MSGRPLEVLDPPKRSLGLKEIHLKFFFFLLLLGLFIRFFNWRVYLFGTSYVADQEKLQQIKEGPKSDVNPAFEVYTGSLKIQGELDNGRPYHWMGKSEEYSIDIQGWSGYNMPYFHTRNRQRLWGCVGIEPHHPLSVAGFPAYTDQTDEKRLMLFAPDRVLSVVLWQGSGLLKKIKFVQRIDRNSNDFQIRWPLNEPIDFQ